jgi:hypothetical protein
MMASRAVDPGLIRAYGLTNASRRVLELITEETETAIRSLMVSTADRTRRYNVTVGYAGRLRPNAEYHGLAELGSCRAASGTGC